MVKKEKRVVRGKASFGKRIVAYILDGIFTGLLMILLIIPGVVYFFIKDGLKNGSSWGKRIMGLKVIQLENNKPCTKAQSALRSIFMAITPLNLIEFFVVLADKNGQRLADKLLKTQVVEA